MASRRKSEAPMELFAGKRTRVQALRHYGLSAEEALEVEAGRATLFVVPTRQIETSSDTAP